MYAIIGEYCYEQEDGQLGVPSSFVLTTFHPNFEPLSAIENPENNLTFAAAKNSYEAVSKRDQ